MDAGLNLARILRNVRGDWLRGIHMHHSPRNEGFSFHSDLHGRVHLRSDSSQHLESSGAHTYISLHYAKVTRTFPTVAVHALTDRPILDRPSHPSSHHHGPDPDMSLPPHIRDEQTQACSSHDNVLSSM